MPVLTVSLLTSETTLWHVLPCFSPPLQIYSI